jgi:hypothetical protein
LAFSCAKTRFGAGAVVVVGTPPKKRFTHAGSGAQRACGTVKVDDADVFVIV